MEQCVLPAGKHTTKTTTSLKSRNPRMKRMMSNSYEKLIYLY
jgi:hypothetical protein